MTDRQLAESEKKSLDNPQDLFDIFSRQIKEMAFELQFGNLIVEFKVRNGLIKEAHRISEEVKLRPF